MLNLDEYKSIEAHWVALYVNSNENIYFDSFRVEHVPKEIKYLQNTSIRFNNGRYFCIEFIDFMLKGKSFIFYTHLFSPNEYENNNKIILKYFQ